MDVYNFQEDDDDSVKQMTKNLQKTRIFWESGISNAVQNQLKISVPNNAPGNISYAPN